MRVITGKARGVQLKTPDGLTTRPTTDRVKEALFSIIQFEIPTARVLDLFGGTGQLGIEALSRGAKSAVFVDAGDPACRLIKENLRRTKLEKDAKVIRSDYLDYLKRCREKFDIVFLDPPYASGFYEPALKKLVDRDMIKSTSLIVCESDNVEIFGHDTYISERFDIIKQTEYGRICITILAPKKEISYD